jgi:hypothetical protein
MSKTSHIEALVGLEKRANKETHPSAKQIYFVQAVDR